MDAAHVAERIYASGVRNRPEALGGHVLRATDVLNRLGVLAVVLFGFVCTANAAGARALPDRQDVYSICQADEGPPMEPGVPRPARAPCDDVHVVDGPSPLHWGTLLVSGIAAGLLVGLFVWMLRQRRRVPAEPNAGASRRDASGAEGGGVG
jgi:hypothetical protein